MCRGLIPGVGVILLGVMSFIKDEQIDVFHFDESMHQALVQNVRGTDNRHVCREVLLPDFFTPKFAAHLSAEAIDLLIEIAFKNSILLEDQRHAVDLIVGKPCRYDLN